MNKDNKKTVIIVIATMLLIGILSVILIAQIAKINKLVLDNKKSEVIEDIQDEQKENDSKTLDDIINDTENNVDKTIEDNKNNVSELSKTIEINKNMLETDKIDILVTKAYSGVKDGENGVYIETLVENKTDQKFKVDAINITSGSNKVDTKYSFTCDKNEKVEKIIFLKDFNILKTSVRFNLTISNPTEEVIMYNSGDITINITENEDTVVIKTTELEPTEYTLEKERKEAEEARQSEEQQALEEAEAELKETEQDRNSVYTRVGEYRYGFFKLPGEFKVTNQTDDKIEYTSSDFIKVTYMYKPNTTSKDYIKQFKKDNWDLYSRIEFNEYMHETVEVYKDKDTKEIVFMEEDGTKPDLSNAIPTTYYRRVDMCNLALEDGNFVMFLTDAPIKGDIAILAILVPYELNDIFTEFVESVITSYEFIQ